MQLRWSIEKTPRKSQFGKKSAKVYHSLYSSIEQLKVALWTYMFLKLGINNDKSIHTLPLESLHLLSLHLYLSLSKPSLSSPWSAWLLKHKEWLSVPQLWQDDRNMTGIWQDDRQEYDRQRTLGKYMINFSEHSGLFWFVWKQFCFFRLFRYGFETPKQTEIYFFGFTKQTETNAKQILFQFVSVQTKFFFFLEDTLYRRLIFRSFHFALALGKYSVLSNRNLNIFKLNTWL
jgi:hypothetical protein